MAEDTQTGIVIEVKYAEKNALAQGCQEALAQIEKNNYVSLLEEEGMTSIIKYGIAFFKKNCLVMRG